jgi:hypothetical protein
VKVETLSFGATEYPSLVGSDLWQSGALFSTKEEQMSRNMLGNHSQGMVLELGRLPWLIRALVLKHAPGTLLT